MGWWKIAGTQTIIGDGPLDALSAAVRETLAAYRAELDRRPTRAEWEALLLGALGVEEPEHRPFADATIARVNLETEQGHDERAT
jgi:hypothetical protein